MSASLIGHSRSSTFRLSAEHADLVVRDLTRRPRVLTSDAAGGVALLEKPGLIQNKNRILIGQGLQRIFTHDVAQRVPA